MSHNLDQILNHKENHNEKQNEKHNENHKENYTENHNEDYNINQNIKLLRNSNLADVSYAYASEIAEGSKIYHLAGACPLDRDGKVPENLSIGEQATLCVENIQSVLAQIGATLKDIAYTRVLVATQDRDDLVEAWHAYEAFMGEHDAPSTLHGVTVLGYPNQKVEIEVVVAIK